MLGERLIEGRRVGLAVRREGRLGGIWVGWIVVVVVMAEVRRAARSLIDGVGVEEGEREEEELAGLFVSMVNAVVSGRWMKIWCRGSGASFGSGRGKYGSGTGGGLRGGVMRRCAV